MALSEHEQQALREIEQSLLANDPDFGASVSGETSFGANSGAITLRGVALIVVGLCMMVGGIALAQQSLWFVSLSVLGFLVMFGSGVWMLRGNSEDSLVAVGAQSSTRDRGKQSKKGGSDVGNRLEDNFRRRFEGR
ncbi:DUF3040 domain-containing protein [Corynebacterium guaraldiae]|uniref:DUF3040 domain-containing protein n=3 Tax=Corynebacterium TaxID=1716 RepID=A0ABU9UI38_9CORY|nr:MULTISPECIES: DUF3040 domain-containing protein [Corynebacterium]MCG7261662.1 DUF3040 domain-containing protein [Corynebacterium aurimucosum]MCL8493617.1 DUF3040 domain-containing protein [Corynebacterium intestinale]MCP1389849.1 DUF3040 domain-containing protein [Corynebacterium intestinale]OFK93541.1 hypothetical protein HMPREF2792_10095 [Corynebacterium sp. HMSC068H04]OFN16241.1 hypothetical protein HMPREF2604_11285 [Corynebacterium sp. HMSC055A01]